MSEFTTIDPAACDSIEARIVAWTLEEASVFEAAELERLCQADPALQAFRLKMLALHGRLTAAGGAGDDDAWKLPPDKRAVLLRHLTPPLTVVRGAVRKGPGLRWALAAAACLALAGLVFLRGNNRPPAALAMEDSVKPNLAERAAGDPYPINRRAEAKNLERQVLVTPLPAQRAPSPAAAELSAIPAAEMVQMTPLTNDREDILSFENARQGLAAVTPQEDSVATDKLVARESAQASVAPILKELRPALRRNNVSAGLPPSADETSATRQPYSTFVIPVGDASFQLAKSQLALGQRPDPAAIQPEQFYNAVDYRDPAASATEPVVAILEQSRHPLAPGRNLLRISLACRAGTQKVKIQVIFNPQRVGNYQLYGFKGTTDAAAEIGGSGTALYQIEPLASGRGDLGEISVRFRDPTTGEMVERSWKIPYTPEPSAFASAPPSMQLAGLSLLAAEKLKGGPLAERIDFKKLKASQSRVQQFYADQPQVAEMLEVIRQITSSPSFR